MVQGRKFEFGFEGIELTVFDREKDAEDEWLSYVEEQYKQLGGCRTSGCRVDRGLVKQTALEVVWACVIIIIIQLVEVCINCYR